MRKVIIIGFSSLSASRYLAKAGYDVTILEKNSSLGGRARQLNKDGFKLIWGQLGIDARCVWKVFQWF